MTENNNMVSNELPSENNVNKTSKAAAAVKEFFRKKVVSLKRKPHYIALLVTLVTSVIYLLCLRTYSIVVLANFAVQWAGFCVFVNTLLSVLVLALYTSAFPKRKKANPILVTLIFVFYVVMLLLDILYYVRVNDYLLQSGMTEVGQNSLDNAVLHIIFVGISIVVLALLPVYSKLIKMIDTSKDIESNDIHEVIETEDDEN